MSDEVLRSKVKDLLEKMERVFNAEWRKTKLNLDHEMIEHFIDPKGTFFEPDGPDTQIPWASRDALLISYRSLLEEFGGAIEVPSAEVDTATQAQSTKINPDQIVTTPVMTKPSIPAPDAMAATATALHSIPKPQTGKQMIASPGQWPGPMTAPVGVTPASKQGFPNPFARAVRETTPKMPSPMTDGTATRAIKADPAAMRAIASKEKFAHLLEGVKSETIRDFVIADGANSGTGKPTLIIYTLENIWLEFAFPFEEGLRILNKYPQRDAELIEFMKSAGHNE